MSWTDGSTVKEHSCSSKGSWCHFEYLHGDSLGTNAQKCRDIHVGKTLMLTRSIHHFQRHIFITLKMHKCVYLHMGRSTMNIGAQRSQRHPSPLSWSVCRCCLLLCRFFLLPFSTPFHPFF